MATAVAAVAPFPVTTCEHPFTGATVKSAVMPDFPESVREEGFGGVAVSEVYVALDPTGKLADAWTFSSSGYPALDRAALVAARRSKYAAPISYCRSVGGTYIFRADFEPY
jgi:TonB family protein